MPPGRSSRGRGYLLRTTVYFIFAKDVITVELPVNLSLITFCITSEERMPSSDVGQSLVGSWQRLGYGLLALVVFIIARRILHDYLYEKKYRFPPIVPGLPIVGNSLQLPTRVGLQGPYLAKLADKYGEM